MESKVGPFHETRRSNVQSGHGKVESLNSDQDKRFILESIIRIHKLTTEISDNANLVINNYQWEPK